jgi:uncharacterized membrane protein (UPF0127 family)
MDFIKVVFYPKNSKMISLECEVAKSFFSKLKGFMNRDSLSEKSGMIFLNSLSWFRVFWMKNVKIPLDIIFVNKNLEVIMIHEAPVETGYFYKKYWSGGLCRYVIECNLGFCRKNDIVVGTKISFEK